MSITPSSVTQHVSQTNIPFYPTKPTFVKKRPSHCETPGRDMLRKLIAQREETRRQKEESLERLHQNCHNAQLEVNDFNEEDAEKICEVIFNHSKKKPDLSKQEIHKKSAIQKLLFEIEELTNQQKDTSISDDSPNRDTQSRQKDIYVMLGEGIKRKKEEL